VRPGFSAARQPVSPARGLLHGSRMSHRRFILLLGLLVTACIPPVYTRTGDRVLPARPPDCAFSLYTVSPPPAAVELGVIQFSGQQDVQSARTEAAPLVCAAGGNGLVLWIGEKDGNITTATVIATPR
jgi:hypothetical protein